MYFYPHSPTGGLQCTLSSRCCGSLGCPLHSLGATEAAEGPHLLQGAGQEPHRKAHSLSSPRPTKHSSLLFLLGRCQEVHTDQGTVFTKLNIGLKSVILVKENLLVFIKKQIFMKENKSQGKTKTIHQVEPSKILLLTICCSHVLTLFRGFFLLL